MIRALLVDDEWLALHQLEKILQEHQEITIIGACTDPSQAMELARTQKPDVVFMDIHMPKISGMRAAECMQQACPNMDIVFVTAYDAYALEAFELNALDYVLKPIQRPRLNKTIQRLKEQLTRRGKDEPAPPRQMWICAFASLGYASGKEGLPQPFKWRTAKAQELFAYLLHYRGRVVGKDVLLDVLWPDFDPKKGATHLYTTIYQVRQCLKQAGLEVQISNVSGGDGYTLDLRQVLFDVAEWERGIRSQGAVSPDTWAEHQRLFDLYTGEYLGACDYVWAVGERERLRTIWLHHSSQLARSYAVSNQITEAVTIYKRIIELYPYYEEGYLALMMLYDQIGDRSAVETCFRQLYASLVQELGIKLSSDVWNWYHNWSYTSRP